MTKLDMNIYQNDYASLLLWDAVVTFENIKFNVWKTKSPIQCIFNLAYNQEYTENSTNKYVCVYDCIWNSGDHSDISGVFFQFGTGGFNWEK